MKIFYNGIGVLTYWYEFGDAVRQYSIPAVFIEDDEGTKPPYMSPENFDYPDWWYTWIDCDRLIMRLTRQDWALILHYFRMIYGNEVGVFWRWKSNERFRALCKRVYSMISDEYKPKHQRKYNFKPTRKILDSRVERGSINVQAIDEGKFYTIQEVCDLLKFGRQTISRMIDSGELKAFTLPEGREIRIAGEDLLTILTPVKGDSNE